MEKIDNKTTEILAYVAEKSKRWTSQGKDALANLKALGSANLPKGDEIIIAKNIFSEHINLKSVLKEKKVKISEFCEKAGLGDAGSYSKESPDAFPRRRPREKTSPQKCEQIFMVTASNGRSLLRKPCCVSQ